MCEIAWNQSSYIAGLGQTFDVMVNITNAEYLVTGQFDVVYNSSIINVWTPPTNGTINDTMPPRYCGNIPVNISYAGIGGNWTNSGRLRILLEVPWTQEPATNCSGGDGTGPCGDGYITILTFRGMNAGSGEIAFYDPRQINQMVEEGKVISHPEQRFPSYQRKNGSEISGKWNWSLPRNRPSRRRRASQEGQAGLRGRGG
jgi:hypothetical protein